MIPRLPLPQRLALQAINVAACRLGSLAARLDEHADRRELALGSPAFPQQHDRARKVIADLRARARAARADQADMVGMMFALTPDRSATR